MENSIIMKLEEHLKATGLKPEMIAFYQDLLRAQSKVEDQSDTALVGLNRPDINQRLKEGLPLLTFDDIKFDWNLVKKVFINMLSVFAGYPQLFGTFSYNFSQTDAILKKAARAWFTGISLQRLAPATNLREPLFRDVMQATLRPFLAICSKVLQVEVNQECWRRGFCPICGGVPDFAFLAKEDGARWLVCSRCDMDWIFQRLQCPNCGIQDQDSLAYFTDDKELYRLYVCNRCKKYLKAIDLRQSKNGFDITLERLSTLSMDVQAREYGYS